MQDLMYMAGRMVTRSRYWYLSFGQLNPFSKLMERIYLRLNLLSRYEVAKFSKSTQLTSICLVISYAQDSGKTSHLTLNFRKK